jgi:hypothetical protein
MKPTPIDYKQFGRAFGGGYFAFTDVVKIKSCCTSGFVFP